jgi:hypothetical protein
VSIRIPRSPSRRGQQGFATLILRISTGPLTGFDGTHLRRGSSIDYAALWPNPKYPATPLLLEYLGSDGSGWGHNRSNDVWVLWRFNLEKKEWDQIASVAARGKDWYYSFAPIVRRELAAIALLIDDATIDAASARVIASLDGELRELIDENDKNRLMARAYNQFTERLVRHAG